LSRYAKGAILLLFFAASLFAESEGERLFKSNDPTAAIPLLERELSSGGASSDAYNYLGLSYYQTGQYDKSVAVFEKGLSVPGTDKKVLAYNAGNSAFAAGNYAKADECYSLALAASPDFVKALLNREIPSGGLPCDVGCCVVNVGTVAAVSEAFREGKPLIERSLTISGGACVQPKNLTVPIGTLVSDLVPHEIELKDGMTKKIVVGGPMMGFSMPNADFPVQKNTNGVLFLTDKETSNTPESPCINCGRCIQVCPCGLYPVMMVKSVKGNDLKAAVRFGLDDCIECGACAWICPAKVRLVEKFRTGKQKLRAERQKQARLAAARGGN